MPRPSHGSVAKLGFGGKIRKPGFGKSRACERQLSCFRSFATELSCPSGHHEACKWSPRGGTLQGSPHPLSLPHDHTKSTESSPLGRRWPMSTGSAASAPTRPPSHGHGLVLLRSGMRDTSGLAYLTRNQRQKTYLLL